MFIIAVKYVYWGEDLVPLPSYRVESQRPHLLPRRPHRHDAGNIAATACALRVYASRGELLTPAIVRWLQYQRAHDGGWMSTLVIKAINFLVIYYFFFYLFEKKL